MLALGLFLYAPLYTAHSQRYGHTVHEFPGLRGASYVGSSEQDIIAEIPGKETLIVYYESRAGNRIGVLNIISRSGYLRSYGLVVDTNGRQPFEYTYLDTRGNGMLDVKQRFGEYREPASWVKVFYMYR